MVLKDLVTVSGILDNIELSPARPQSIEGVQSPNQSQNSWACPCRMQVWFNLDCANARDAELPRID